MAKILVTGGAGFIGSALVKRLILDGHQVRVLDNNFRGTKRRLKEVLDKIEFIESDIRDAKKVNRAAKGIDCVIHLAFINGTKFFYEMPELVLDVGVRGMINVLDACQKNDIGELFLASSSEVYQNPVKIPTDETVPLSIPDVFNPRYSYAGGKIITELMAINYGRNFFKRVVIFRPHNVYGPDMGWEHVIPQFILRAKSSIEKSPGDIIPFPIQGDGLQTRAFCYINDFIDGLMLLLEKGEHLNIYNIGNPEEIAIKEVAEKIANYFNRKAKIIPGEPMPGSPMRRCPDISKIASLGYKPKISFDKGLSLTIDWYIKNADLWTKNKNG